MNVMIMIFVCIYILYMFYSRNMLWFSTPISFLVENKLVKLVNSLWSYILGYSWNNSFQQNQIVFFAVTKNQLTIDLTFSPNIHTTMQAFIRHKIFWFLMLLMFIYNLIVWFYFWVKRLKFWCKVHHKMIIDKLKNTYLQYFFVFWFKFLQNSSK